MDRWLLYAGCVLLTGCVLGRAERVAPPVTTALSRGPLAIQADFALDEQHPVLGELSELRHRVSHTLELPISEQRIQIYLFATPDQYYSTLAKRFPGFPVRRAFFVKHAGCLEVYAQWSQRAGEDLRHETTHAYLHAALNELPLWLDEGLAEYFETPPNADGWNAPHADLLLAEFHARRWRPDLQRLESLPSSAEMNQIDYAEAWAWTYVLLRSGPESRQVLVRYLDDARQGRPLVPLAKNVHLNADASSQLLIATLEEGRRQRVAAGIR